MIVTCDFETYYDQQYSLSRMGTAAYILDHRFQTIMCAVKVNNNSTEIFLGHREVARRFAEIDWANAALLAHHTNFDAAILAWHYGIMPAMYLDTLSMARATTHWVLGRSSLAKVSDYLGLPPKGDEVVRAIGKHLEDFSPDELRAYADYCSRDNDNCRGIFDRLRPLFPNSELRLIDLVVRMFVEPQVQLDSYVLAEHLHQVKAEKAAIMAKVAHIDPTTFSSQLKFKTLLESYGVEVPTKTSPATGEEIPALAKNDRAFKELCMDEDQPLEVQALLAARINSKSTLEETRTQKLLDHSLREWYMPDASAGVGGARHGEPTGRGRLGGHMQGVVVPAAPPPSTGWAAVPLKYYGARPGRLSGDGGENWQNFKRGSRIREGIRAPDGYRVVHRDASQIEARINAWLAGCEKLLSAFRDPDRDVYCEFASGVYSRRVTRADKGDRFVGKTGVLGLGYGCGHEKFRHMLFIGNGGMSMNVTEEEARRIVWHYRSEYPEIPALWRTCEFMLSRIVGRRSRKHTLGYDLDSVMLQLERMPVEPGYDALWLPNGMCIAYPNLRFERNPASMGPEIVYDDPYGGSRKIWGGKTVQNICEALSRIIVTDIAVRVFDLTGRHPFLSTHDSLDYCVPIDEVAWYDQELARQFEITPSWGDGLPLASEGGWGTNLMAAERGDNE